MKNILKKLWEFAFIAYVLFGTIAIWVCAAAYLNEVKTGWIYKIILLPAAYLMIKKVNPMNDKKYN